jgi:LacI family transcriptional regulator
MTMGAIEGLQGRASHIALVGFDEFALADKLTPRVTVVAQDPAAIGATAAQLLFARIDGDTSLPRDVVLRTRLVVRGSGEIPPAVIELPAPGGGRRGPRQPSSGT